jgi:hypothetical protein
LPDGCPICRVPRGSDILYTDENDVTAAKLAIDCLIEQSEVASAAFDLELRPDQTCVVGRVASDPQGDITACRFSEPIGVKH